MRAATGSAHGQQSPMSGFLSKKAHLCTLSQNGGDTSVMILMHMAEENHLDTAQDVLLALSARDGRVAVAETTRDLTPSAFPGVEEDVLSRVLLGLLRQMQQSSAHVAVLARDRAAVPSGVTFEAPSVAGTSASFARALRAICSSATASLAARALAKNVSHASAARC